MKELVIFGAGGLGKEVACLVDAINKDSPTWKMKGFFDDGLKRKQKVNGYEILGGLEQAKDFSGFVVIAIGDPHVKKEIANALDQSKFATLIHPSSEIMDARVQLGVGTIISCGAVLTTNINIGDHVLINLNSTIGHDSRISSYSSLMCGVNIAGGVEVSECVFVGSGANVLNGLKIGENTRIGAGSVVNKDIGSNKTAVGIPARAI